MKKIIILATLSLTVMAACSTPDYQKELDLSEDVAKVYLDKIDEKLALYNNPEDEDQKIDAAFVLGLNHMYLGEYGKAISYYEEVLDARSSDFATLNNLSFIYKDLAMYDKAIEYQEALYMQRSNYGEVVGDLVDLYFKTGQLDAAQTAIDHYASTQEGQNEPGFVADLREQLEEQKSQTP